jgi:hypothetical protein
MDFNTSRQETSGTRITSTAWSGAERRIEIRIATDGPARVKVLDPLISLGPSFQASLVDTSDKGLKLQVPRSILPGSVVQIRLQDRIVLGEVRYCNPSGSEFHIGLRLKEEW